jgi:hypothetical protein
MMVAYFYIGLVESPPSCIDPIFSNAAIVAAASRFIFLLVIFFQIKFYAYPILSMRFTTDASAIPMPQMSIAVRVYIAHESAQPSTT